MSVERGCGQDCWGWFKTSQISHKPCFGVLQVKLPGGTSCLPLSLQWNMSGLIPCEMDIVEPQGFFSSLGISDVLETLSDLLLDLRNFVFGSLSLVLICCFSKEQNWREEKN